MKKCHDILGSMDHPSIVLSLSVTNTVNNDNSSRR